MFLLIDNYDSFTHNLVQVFQKIGVSISVRRNDDQAIFALIQNSDLQGLIISPGPGGPETSGYCLSILDHIKPDLPVLGVCLGHQILAFFAGIHIGKADRIMHGMTSPIFHNQTGIFSSLPNPFPATRYHSLIMTSNGQDFSSRGILITARSDCQEPMAFEYSDRPWFGVQFHPESILTTEGPKLIENFVQMVIQ
jgi:anthranilate synthase component 2